MQSRLAMTGADLGTRFSNWSEAVSVMSDNWRTSLFGMGIGSYPETYQLLSLQTNKPAVHRFETEADNTYLQIGHGATFYVEQVVSPTPQSEYQISLRARAQFGDASLNVLLCDRTFLRGFGCQSVTFNLDASQGQWQQLQATLNSINVGANKLRVSKLSLENAGSGASIDVDNIEMISSNGTNMLTNGNFQSGADRWYFSSPNNFAPWRVENLFLHVYFEQGWIGLLMFCLLVTSVISRLARLAWQGKSFALALLAGVAGFLAVGGFDSMFDAPRLILLFGLLVAASGTVYGQPAKIIVDKGPPKAPVNIQTPSTSASRQRETAVDSRLPSSLGWRKLAAAMAWKLLFLAVAIFLFTRLPFVPYNIRELPNPFHPLIAPLLLAAFIFWTFGVPGVIARWLAGTGPSGAWLPLIIVCHGLTSWVMLHFAVLPESIHDVIGSPTLQWAGQTEYVARFVPLVSVLTLQIVGGALLANAGAVRRAAALLWWVLASILLLPLQYLVIVEQAATDNLTELMANGASGGAFLMMALYLLLIGFVGSLLAASHFRSDPSRIFIVLAVVALSLPAGYVLVDAGTASVIVKEQKVFSALQFLLSPDRTHYAAGLTLWLRFAIAHLGLVLLIAFTQHTIWMGSHQQVVKNPP